MLNLVVLLEQPDLLADFAQPGRVGPNLSGFGALVDVGTTYLLLQWHRVTTEASRDLLDRHSRLAAPRHAHNVVTQTRSVRA
ncbi:hypothetical protein M0E87_00015 [Corynebacterium sp. CCM 9185]|uniref:Uncharacterized protein n=1 Tax=Corynebacterium marambiense TaxID=2765364 RepID=A0ABS0VXY5_9CORY|nr:hypothetical protein [Corynebacterium marambiense]MBI9001590.1 hypothetical protein [Corynebacterium marambiense]MCK7662056.1 hypothetical protein [Corynebacterium marambiense]